MTTDLPDRNLCSFNLEMWVGKTQGKGQLLCLNHRNFLYIPCFLAVVILDEFIKNFVVLFFPSMNKYYIFVILKVHL